MDEKKNEIAKPPAAPPAPSDVAIDLHKELAETQVAEVLDELDRELVGLAPVKTRIREIAALLLVDRVRRSMGLVAETPTLHMSFTGNPGTGKTTVALRMAEILHKLGYIRRGHLVSVTRDDLVGQYIGHTAPKTKEVLKKAMGGVLFIDEAYYLYRPENERDYGQEAIEILLQVMENQRDDLVVIFAGYADRMDKFFRANPGFRSRIAHHIDFPDYSDAELMDIAEMMLHIAELSFRRGRRGGVPRLYRRAAQTAAFRQCPLDPQCARPDADAPGEPAFRPPRPRHARRSDDDHCGGCARQPRVQSGRGEAGLRGSSRRRHQRTESIQLEDVVHVFNAPRASLQSSSRR